MWAQDAGFPSADLHQDADLAWIESALAAQAEPVAGEVAIWVKDGRQEGRREGDPRGYDGIRHYLMTLQLTPTAWTTTGVTSLWEIATDQVGSAVDDLTGYARRGLATPLRAGQSYQERRKALEWLFTDQQRQPPWTLCPATTDS